MIMYLYTVHVSLNIMDINESTATQSMEARSVSVFSPYF